MPPDPELIAETRAWFRRAELDLRAAQLDLDASPPLSADAVFHAQQAAEKAMKGLLTWHGRPFRKTHNLTEIGAQCVSTDPSLEPLLRRASTLTDYAWRFRYPGDLDEPPQEEAQEALGVAGEVYEAILDRVPSEARP